MKENTINFKENINNNKSNKLYLPTTWTKKKMASLLLMSWLSVNGVSGGEQFKKCLRGYVSNVYTDKMYDTITSFASGIPDKQWFCCNNGFRGLGPLACSHMTALKCPYSGFGYDIGQCNKVGRSRICIMGTGADEWGQPMFPAGLCGGILGDALASNDVVGNCPNLEVVKNSLNGPTTASGFSWLCCDNINCSTPINVELKVGWDYLEAHTNCPLNQYNLMCFEDNKGWSCTGNQSSILENVYRPMDASCILQLADESKITESSLSSTSTTTSTSLSLPPSTSQLGNEDTLSNSDKIALGTGLGIGVPTTVATVAGVALAYKQYKEKKKKKKEEEEEKKIAKTQAEIKSNEFGEGTSQSTKERVVNNEIVQQETQIQIDPK